MFGAQPAEAVVVVAISSNGQSYVTGGADGTLFFFQEEGERSVPCAFVDVHDVPSALCWTPDSQHVIVGCR